MPNYSKVTSIINQKLYPVIAKKMDTRAAQVKKEFGAYFNRNPQIYDVAPYDLIYYKDSDKDAFFKALDIKEEEINNIMKDCFYWNIPYNPGAAKEPYVVTLMCIIRYYLKNNKQKDAEAAAIYLCFTGKFYASIFRSKGVFPVVSPSKYKAVMDYVVNNMLTQKFDLKTTGSVFLTIQKICITWINTYKDDIISNQDDDEVGKDIQQLRGRVHSFLYNIAQLYYKAYQNKNYLNMETENLDSDMGEFRLTENDSLRASRITEAAVSSLTRNSVNMTVCKMSCKDAEVKPTELFEIMEAICSDKSNLPEIHRVVNIIICDFIRNNPKSSIGGVEFIVHTIRPKPNIKDKYIVELRETIMKWLDEKSPNFRRRRNRKATAISYYKAVLMYITLIISKVSEKG